MALSYQSNILTTYKIYYNYRSVIKELKITVYDPKEPVLNNITALVNNANYTSGTFVNKDVDLTLIFLTLKKRHIYPFYITYFFWQIDFVIIKIILRWWGNSYKGDSDKNLDLEYIACLDCGKYQSEMDEEEDIFLMFLFK